MRLSKGQIESELRTARGLYQRGDPAGAIQRIEAVLRAAPDSVLALFGKATILGALDRPSEALESLTSALKHDPSNFEALFYAAQLSLQLQRPEQAEALALRLAKLRPHMDQAHFLLAIARISTGRWVEALEAISCALDIQPSNVDYLLRKGQLLYKLQFYALAIECYRTALKLRPEAQIGRDLAACLLEEGYVREALTLLQQYPPDGSSDPGQHILMARIYTESQRHGEAAAHWANAARLSSDPTPVRWAQARSEVYGGRLNIAESLLREALTQNPSSTQLFEVLAPITKLSDADSKMVQIMEDTLTKGQIDPTAKQGLCYALGKAHQDLGDYERAMALFDEANRIRGELAPPKLKFDPVEWKQRVDFQIEFFTKERISALATDGLDSQKPLFVAGMIRSGTTLTEQILSCHSQISAGGENRFWVDHRDELANPTTRRYDAFSAKRLGKEYLKNIEAFAHGAQYVVDKNPLNVLTAGALHCVLPNAKWIHVRRHPVDNLLSIWMTPLNAGLQFISTREELVFAYREYLRLAGHLEALLPDDRLMSITYEGLTAKPALTIEQVLDFLGLDVETACFHPENNPRTVKTPSMYQARQPINTLSQARWKQYEKWLGPFRELLESEGN